MRGGRGESREGKSTDVEGEDPGETGSRAGDGALDLAATEDADVLVDLRGLGGNGGASDGLEEGLYKECTRGEHLVTQFGS